MTTLLANLEQQLAAINADITNKLLRLASNDADRSSLITQIDQHLDDSKELVRNVMSDLTVEQIELEIHSLSSADRKSHLTHLEGFQREYQKFKNDFKNAKQSLKSESDVRIDLFGDDSDNEKDDKARLLNDTQRLEATSRKLESGYRLCLESEQLGAQILGNLDEQRETIRRSRDKLRSTNYELGRGSRIANIMIRRAMQTKAIIYFVGLIITLFIIYMVYDSFNIR